MPSSYTTSLRLTLPATGELSGQWGNTVNTGITELLDASVAGTTTITTWGGPGVSYTLSNNSGTADEARRMFIVATGTPGEAKNVICPAVSKMYVFRNDTTGGFALTLKTSGGTGVAVPAGQYKFLYCDGTNVVEAVNSLGPVASLSASQAVFTDASKNLVSNAITGTGNVVMSTSPTLVTPALGTPTALVGTNITGTATAFNINGTVGATTPAAGAFTTLSASSTVSGTGFSTYLASPPAIGGTAAAAGSFTTLSASSTVTLSGGTANGVLYLNGSKVATTGSALTFDGTTFQYTGAANFATSTGNVGIGTASPTDTGGFGRVVDIQSNSGGQVVIRDSDDTTKFARLAFDGNLTNIAYVGAEGSGTSVLFRAGGATRAILDSNGLEVKESQLIGYSSYAGIGTNGLAVAGNVGIGTSSPGAKLDVQFAGVGIQLKQSVVGAATYYVMDNTVETGGKRWRFGYTGAAGIPTFSLYNATDNVTAWVADTSGNLGLGVTPSAYVGYNTLAQNAVTGSTFEQRVGGVLTGSLTTDSQVTLKSLTAIPVVFGTNNAEAGRFSSDGTFRVKGAGTAGSTDAVQFSGSAPADAMRLTTQGDLGVGATTININGWGKAVTVRGVSNAAYEVTDGTVVTNLVAATGSYGIVGTQTNHPLLLRTNGTERAQITSTGNVVAGGSVALATTATDGFLYVPTCAGTPTGVPTAITGMAPIVVNTTNNKLYFYSGGAWRDAGP